MRARFAVFALSGPLVACALRTESAPSSGPATGGQATEPEWTDGIGGGGGPSTAPGGATVWSTAAGRGHPAAVVGLHDGGAVIAGDFSGKADFGLGSLQSAGALDAFVVRFDDLGAPKWSRRFGGTDLDVVTRAAAAPAGGVWIAGHFHGTTELGGQPLSSAGDSDVFLVELDAEGEHVRSMRFGGAGTQRVSGLAVDAAGGVMIAGWFRDEIDVGGEALVAGDDSMEGFVARLDSTGAPIWARRIGGPGDQRVGALARAPDGDTWIAGEFRESALEIGAAHLVSSGYGDLFVARLDPLGVPRWAKRFGGAGDDGVISLSAEPNGQLTLLGYFGDDASVDGEPIAAIGPHNPFVLTLDASGIAVRLARFGDGTWSQTGQDVLALSGSPVVAGAFTGTLTVDAHAVASAGAASDAFVARSGEGGWLRAFRSADPATAAAAVALGRHVGGDVLVTGELSGAVWTARLSP